MKKSILLAAALLVTANSSFADCKCGLPSYTEDDETTAIYNFMASGVNATDIREITVTETIPYTTYRIGLTKCEVECLNKANSVRKLHVEFVRSSKLCSVNLKVTMKSKRRGFKSVVKQKYAPVCQ